MASGAKSGLRDGSCKSSPVKLTPPPSGAWALPLAGLLLAATSHTALAVCSPVGSFGFITPGASGAPTVVTCDTSGTQTTRVGQGGLRSPAPPNADWVNVIVNGSAVIDTTNDNAISLGSHSNIVINAGATVRNTSSSGPGQYNDGNNTIDINANSTVTIVATAQVIAAGTQSNSEAINPYGPGNTITNYGLIQGGSGAALFFENVNTSATDPRNKVDNYGVIQVVRVGQVTPDPNGEAIGSFQNVGIDFINETGAKVIGNLQFAGGNDTITLNPGSVITGNMDGGGGNNLITLNASATSSDSMPGSVSNFQTMNKTGAGTWTLTGAVGNNGGATPLAVTVMGGTLVLTGDNSNFNGSVLIDPAGTLEARAQSLPNPTSGQGVITDNGVLLVNQVSPDGIQPNDGTYAGVVNGTGVLTKIGSGTLTLTGANTYSGGTNFNVGAIAVGADSALGAPTGPLTFNGGALRFLSSFDLSPSRPIVLNGPNGGLPGGGTIDSNGFQTTIAQGITGAGGLTVTDSTVSTGVVILTGANAYAGGTTIAAGTLQLGAGGTSGNILGDVTDNGTLAFDRSDVVTFPGVISGMGGVAQIGTGTTVLNAVNPYSGPTRVTSGVLAIGDAAHPSASLSGGGAVTVAPGAKLGGYGGVAGNVFNFGTVAVADAVPAFSGGPTGAFTIGGNFQNLGVAQIGGSSIGNVLSVMGNYTTLGGRGVVAVSTLLNDGGPLSHQQTDRLLVFGNASGASSLTVNAFGLGAFTTPDAPSANHGISIVQVAGTSSVGAFTLPGGYVDGGTPYRYQLYAFGPGSPNGSASASQSLVGNAGANWDYRLENVYVSPVGPVTPVEPLPPDSRPELAPQIPAYVVLPNALFNAGLQDLDSLHRRLGEIRDDQLVKGPTDGEVFIRGYGAALNDKSSRSFSDYGINSTQDYGATQFGANWIARSTADGTLRAGLAASLGQLWYEPHALDGASSGLFDTETLVGALTWQSRAGWYVDGLVAGGLFNGTVSTGTKGQVLSTNGTSVAASLEAGYPIALGWQGLALEPQLQIVYQNLNFARKADVDGVDVNPGVQTQGVFRGGARLVKPFASSDGALYTAYLKANVITGIGGGGTIMLGADPFPTSTFGTSIQVGAGANGKINRNLSIYGDVAWQDGVAGGGSRGWLVNGGLRYAF